MVALSRRGSSNWMFFVAAGIIGSAIMAMACLLGTMRVNERPWNSFRAIWLSADILSMFLVGLVANALAFLGPKPFFTRGPGIFFASVLAAVSFPLVWYFSGDLLLFAFLLSPGLLGLSLVGMGACYFAYTIKRKSNPEAGVAGFFYSLSGMIILVTYFNVMFQYGAYISLGWTYLLPGTIFACVFYFRVFAKEVSEPRPKPRRTRA
ncbi:MAG: hypothetical protein KAW84_05605 [Thermoplasmata archaeon]|nr:hypothetical protein [Thermoplasmata archaeon]